MNPAEAGFFSFFERLLGSGEPDSIVSQAQIVNSQNLPILKASLNLEPSAALGGGNITIVGQSALLPDIGPLGSIADIEDQKAADQISVYVVQEKDNLSAIARMFDIDVNTILWANNLNRSDFIITGQTLVILPVPGVRYEIKKGDTLENIAKKLKGDIDEIIQFNSLALNQPLTIGDTIIIPNGEVAALSGSSASRQYGLSNPYKGGGGPNYSGYYIRPIVGGRKSQGLHGYNGVDLAVSCGSPVLASASGDVIVSRTGGWNGGYGNFIIINHLNGTQTLYSHNSSNIVGVGWHVIQGQIIGYVGSTGNATGCHVHFEIRGAKNPF